MFAGCRPLRHTVVFPNPHPTLTRAKHLSLSELKPYNMAKDWATVNALVTTTRRLVTETRALVCTR